MKNKIISCTYDEAETKVQPLLENGEWTVKECYNENVFVAGSKLAQDIRGKIIFLLQKS